MRKEGHESAPFLMDSFFSKEPTGASHVKSLLCEVGGMTLLIIKVKISNLRCIVTGGVTRDEVSAAPI